MTEKAKEKTPNRIRMAAVDLDGTLLRSDKTISRYTERVIGELRERGILFVIATARPVRGVKAWLPFLSYDAAFFHNGSVIELPDGTETHIGISDCVPILKSILRAFPGHPIGVDCNEMLYANFDAKTIWNGIDYIATEDFHELADKTPEKILIEAHSLDDLERFRRFLPEGLQIRLSENVIAMVMNAEATKAGAVRRIAEAAGISMEEVVSFGDDYVDIDMLTECGIGVAPENAQEDVKKHADEICADNDHDGVARWIEKNLLGLSGGYSEDTDIS